MLLCVYRMTILSIFEECIEFFVHCFCLRGALPCTVPVSIRGSSSTCPNHIQNIFSTAQTFNGDTTFNIFVTYGFASGGQGYPPFDWK